MTDKILIVGTGAIGGFYGALLAKSSAEISVVCRSDYQQVKNYGFKVESSQFGDLSFRPHQILANVGEYPDRADYLILCTKVLPELNRVKLIQDAVSAQTSIVLIQNGIDIEQEIADAFPDNEVISALAFVCSNRIEAGVISHLAYGRLTLGSYPHGISRKTEHLAQLFRQCDLECICTEDIIAGRWQKCVWNAPFNPLSVLSGGLLTKDILSTQEGLVRHIMREVCAIAEACGHALPDDIVDINISNTYTMPPYKTSMLLDFDRHHTMEIEAILGNSVRKAHELEIDCPYLESIYAMMKLKELALKKSITTE